MSLSSATEQTVDTRAAVAASVFLSGWHNPRIAGIDTDPDEIYTWHPIIDRPWTKCTFWALSSASTTDYSVDITLDYIPAIDDTDSWDQALTNSGTLTFTPTAERTATLLEFTVAGLEPGKVCYIEFSIGNWTNTSSRNFRMGNLHLHTPADA